MRNPKAKIKSTGPKGSPISTYTPYGMYGHRFLFIPNPSNKYKYILNIVDRYSHKLFSVATTNMTSNTVTKALEDIFSKFGPPRYLNSDNQLSLLRSQHSLQFLSKWGSSIKTGIAYNSRSQSLVETMNNALKYMLKALSIQHDNNKWHELLKLATYLMNTTPSSALPNHLTPDEVFFGRTTSPFPIGHHKVQGHVLPTENLKIIKENHQRNQLAIKQFLKKRKESDYTKSKGINTYKRFSVGSSVYFRQINPNNTDNKSPK